MNKNSHSLLILLLSNPYKIERLAPKVRARRTVPGPEGVVARDINKARMRELALVGAKARLEELKQEEAQLRSDFPELGRASRTATPAASGGKRRRRKPMSAAQRKEVSERMTKYWAERRRKGK